MYTELSICISIRNDFILITHFNSSYVGKQILRFLIVGLLLMFWQEGLCFELYLPEVVMYCSPLSYSSLPPIHPTINNKH